MSEIPKNSAAPTPDGFYTMKGYTRLSGGSALTSAMEDYLEMIARLQRRGGGVRVMELAQRLHVKAPSVTKMIQQLARAGLVGARKYGEIVLTERGAAMGAYLLYRHDVLHRFLCLLNGTENELEQAEKIEHSVNEETVRNLDRLCRQMAPPAAQKTAAPDQDDAGTKRPAP